MYDLRNHNPRVGGSNPSTATSKKPFDIGIYRVKGLFLCAALFAENRPKRFDLALFDPLARAVCAQFPERY